MLVKALVGLVVVVIGLGGVKWLFRATDKLEVRWVQEEANERD